MQRGVKGTENSGTYCLCLPETSYTLRVCSGRQRSSKRFACSSRRVAGHVDARGAGEQYRAAGRLRLARTAIFGSSATSGFTTRRWNGAARRTGRSSTGQSFARRWRSSAPLRPWQRCCPASIRSAGAGSPVLRRSACRSSCSRCGFCAGAGAFGSLRRRRVPGPGHRTHRTRRARGSQQRNTARLRSGGRNEMDRGQRARVLHKQCVVHHGLKRVET
jgi:hypothetical protein